MLFVASATSACTSNCPHPNAHNYTRQRSQNIAILGHSAASQTRSNMMLLLLRWSSTLSLSDILTTNVQIIVWR